MSFNTDMLANTVRDFVQRLDDALSGNVELVVEPISTELSRGFKVRFKNKSKA